MLRDVETIPGQTASTSTSQPFQEQNKCCDDAETKFKWIQTRLNMSQHL